MRDSAKSTTSGRLHRLGANDGARCACVLVACTLLAAATGTPPASRATRPETVSPGLPDEVLEVESACPTFNWAGVENASGYELEVYRIPDHLLDGQETSAPVLRTRLTGTTDGWTPSLGRCLARDTLLGWRVRALFDQRAGVWSDMALFRIAPALVSLELGEALRILRAHLAAGGDLRARSVAFLGPGGQPAKGMAAAPLFQVDGNVQASGFSGNIDAGSIHRGTLPTGRFSAFIDLSIEGYLANDGPEDLLVQAYLDSRYLNIGESHDISATDIDSGVLSTAYYNAYNDLYQADRLDGYERTDLLTRSLGDLLYLQSVDQADLPEMQGELGFWSEPCPTWYEETFPTPFSSTPVVSIVPRRPAWSFANTYCVISSRTPSSFRHCCYGNVALANYIAVAD